MRPERHKQIHPRVEGEIAVHHGADAQGGDLFQLHAVLLLHIGFQIGIGSAEPGEDGLLAVGPDAGDIIILPLMAPGRDDPEIRADENALDPGGPELDPQDNVAGLNQFLTHDENPPAVLIYNDSYK